MTIKEQLVNFLYTLPDPKTGIITRFKKDNNRGPQLASIYIWQEVAALAEKWRDGAWKVAQREGLLPTDDEMRALAEGEHIVGESQQFSVLAKLTRPRHNFDLDMFIEKLSEHGRCHLTKAELTSLAETCKPEGKTPLSKRVVEV